MSYKLYNPAVRKVFLQPIALLTQPELCTAAAGKIMAHKAEINTGIKTLSTTLPK